MGIGVCAHSQRICLRGTQSRGTFNGRLRELSAWGMSIRPWAKFVPPWRHNALEGGLPSPAAGFESCYVSFCGAQIFHQSFPGRWFLGLRPVLSPWVTRQGGIRLVNQEAYIWSACQPRAKGKGRTLGLHVVNSTSSSGSTNAEDPCPMSTIARRRWVLQLSRIWGPPHGSLHVVWRPGTQSNAVAPRGLGTRRVPNRFG